MFASATGHEILKMALRMEPSVKLFRIMQTPLIRHNRNVVILRYRDFYESSILSNVPNDSGITCSLLNSVTGFIDKQ